VSGKEMRFQVARKMFRLDGWIMQLSSADVSGLLTLVDWLFPAPGRATATAVSPSRDRVRGTVFLLNSEHQMLDLKRSDAN